MSRVLGEGWAVPDLDDSNRAFFTSGALTLQRCCSCGHVQHPPEDVCEDCQGQDFGGFESVGNGCIESVAVAHHPVHPVLQDRVPYAIVLVSVADAPGLLVTGNVVGTDPGEVRIGDRVRVVFEAATDPESGETLQIPQWEILR
ncbi:MAG: OB-fold domain-containing protein [Gemmatimonadota bacterium]|jgi:uncharacterized OB-fold protein